MLGRLAWFVESFLERCLPLANGMNCFSILGGMGRFGHDATRSPTQVLEVQGFPDERHSVCTMGEHCRSVLHMPV